MAYDQRACMTAPSKTFPQPLQKKKKAHPLSEVTVDSISDFGKKS
jgi:hypothetical protein